MEDVTNNQKWEPPTEIVIGIWVLIILAVVCLTILHKNNYDRTIAGPMVAGLISIVVGASAAFFGAQSALRAAQRTHLNNLDLRKQDREAQVRGVIQAIYAELTSLSEIYRNEFADEWEKFEVGEPFETFYPISQEYFTIYNGNAALIGQIPDDELRTSIVKAYLASKGLIDTHLLNNRLLDDYAAARRHYRNNETQQNKELRDEAYEELTNYSEALKSSYEEANAAVGHVLNLIEKSGLAPNVSKTSS